MRLLTSFGCPNLDEIIMCPECKEWTSLCEPCCGGSHCEDCGSEE